ncbi:hypothetical protein ACJX0J_035334, partial [Zea mays]
MLCPSCSNLKILAFLCLPLPIIHHPYEYKGFHKFRHFLKLNGFKPVWNINRMKKGHAGYILYQSLQQLALEVGRRREDVFFQLMLPAGEICILNLCRYQVCISVS